MLLSVLMADRISCYAAPNPSDDQYDAQIPPIFGHGYDSDIYGGYEGHWQIPLDDSSFYRRSDDVRYYAMGPLPLSPAYYHGYEHLPFIPDYDPHQDVIYQR